MGLMSFVTSHGGGGARVIIGGGEAGDMSFFGDFHARREFLAGKMFVVRFAPAR